MAGSAAMVLERLDEARKGTAGAAGRPDTTATELRALVTSPGGTTAAGLRELERGGCGWPSLPRWKPRKPVLSSSELHTSSFRNLWQISQHPSQQPHWPRYSPRVCTGGCQRWGSRWNCPCPTEWVAMTSMNGPSARDSAGGKSAQGGKSARDAGANEGQSATRTQFLTVAEVAALMRVSKMTVYRLVHNGELPAVRWVAPSGFTPRPCTTCWNLVLRRRLTARPIPVAGGFRSERQFG